MQIVDQCARCKHGLDGIVASALRSQERLHPEHYSWRFGDQAIIKIDSDQEFLPVVECDTAVGWALVERWEINDDGSWDSTACNRCSYKIWTSRIGFIMMYVFALELRYGDVEVECV